MQLKLNFLPDLSVLRRNRNYRLVFLGELISYIGTMITSVALPYQIYHATKSVLAVGLLGAFQLVPLLFTALLGGVFADRYHRRCLLIITESFLALTSLALAWNATLTAPHLWLIFAIAMVGSALIGLHRPTLSGILQQVIPKKDFAAAIAIKSLFYSLGMIAAPALGGLLIANFGLVSAFFVDFLTFGAALVTILLLRNIPKPTGKTEASIWLSLRSGFRYSFSRQELLGTYFVDFFAMIFGMPSALFPAMAVHFGGVKTLGLLYSAPAVGTFIAASLSGFVKKIKRHGAAVAFGATMWGIAIICFGLSKNLWWALFFLSLAGGFDALSAIFRGIVWNDIIPNEMRGRIAGIEMISYLSGPKLGDTEAGLVAASFGITTSIVSGGVLCVVAVIACCYALPKFWKYEAGNNMGNCSRCNKTGR